MRKSKQRKLEKKRRAQRQRRCQKSEPLAYHGNKYKTDALIPVHFETEVGIYEAFVISNRQITDHDVRRALERLIRDLRAGTITVSAENGFGGDSWEQPERNLIVDSICRRWAEYVDEEPPPNRDGLIGVLRTILGSIETWGNVSPTSRGYLRYLEGFMGKLGVECREASPEFVKALEDGTADFQDFQDDEEEDEDELLAAGRAWTGEGSSDAAAFFRDLADEMIADGEAKEVAETCQQLMGETADRRIVEELGSLSLRAQQRLQPPPSRRRGLLSRLFGG